MGTDNTTIVLTGGGTGGHITPILAVAHEIKALKPSIHVVYIGERGGKFDELTRDHAAIDRTFAVSAGKLRRYHGESWLRRLTDFRTIALNFRDLFRFIAGTFQAWRLLGKVRPAVVFQKGGFVGVPVGLAAAMRRIPIVTHDSDALPGLANRMVSRWARVHATALTAEYYSYPESKVVPVGVLVEHSYQPVTKHMQQTFKRKIGISEKSQLLLVTGGSSGAELLNKAVAAMAEELLHSHPMLQIIHQTGKGKADVYGSYTHQRLMVLEFMNPMFEYTGAADLIVTRAGANAMAEFGVQGKACIVVPNKFLTGGHQVKNARLLEEKGAVLVVHEEQMYDLQHGLQASAERLLDDEAKRHQLAEALQAQTIPDAAQRVARLLLEQIEK